MPANIVKRRSSDLAWPIVRSNMGISRSPAKVAESPARAGTAATRSKCRYFGVSNRCAAAQSQRELAQVHQKRVQCVGICGADMGSKLLVRCMCSSRRDGRARE
jgi:hypothetical protein